MEVTSGARTGKCFALASWRGSRDLGLAWLAMNSFSIELKWHRLDYGITEADGSDRIVAIDGIVDAT